MGEALQKQQNRDDLDAVFRAETALKDDYLSFEREELGKYGENAKGASERAAQWWAEKEKAYGEGLTDRQAFAYKRSATQLRQASSSTLYRHEQHQSNRALQESSTARVGTAVNMAIADPTDERVANSRREIMEAVNIASNLAGDPPEVRERKLAESMTMMHKGIVTRLADSDNPADLDRAKAYYYTNKKEIDGPTQLVIEKTLERSTLLTETQAEADKIMPQFGDDMAAAMAHIEKTYSGEKEKTIKAEVLSRFTTAKGAKQGMSQSAYESALLHAVQGRKIPNTVWNQMDDGHKAAIIDRQRAEQKRREAEANGREIKTDFQTWDKINRLVTESPTDFVKLDIGRFSDRLSRADMEEFGKLQRKIRSGDDKPVKEAVSLSQQVDVVLDGLRLKANTPDHAQARKAIYDALNTEQNRSDKPLTYDERQAVIDRVTMEAVTSKGFFWDSTERLYKMTPEQRAKATPNAEDRQKIVQKFKARGVEAPTEEQINNAFRAWRGL